MEKLEVVRQGEHTLKVEVEEFAEGDPVLLVLQRLEQIFKQFALVLVAVFETCILKVQLGQK